MMLLKPNFRRLRNLAAVLLALLAGTTLFLSTAQADIDEGLKKLRQIQNRPCLSYIYQPGNSTTLPHVSCLGRNSTRATIYIPIRSITVHPPYPLVGETFHVAVGLDPDSAGGVFTSRKVNLTYKDKLKVNGYAIQVRLAPVPVTNSFNGQLQGDGSMAYHAPPRGKNQTIPELSVPGAGDLPYSLHYQNDPDIQTTAQLGMSASMSSYHAEAPVYFQDEPAYSLSATSVWRLEARARWDSYQLWEYQGTYEVCVWGRNEYGWFECDVGDGDPWWEGRYIEVDRYAWGRKRISPSSSDWMPVAEVTTDLIRWPDGTVHDSYPLHVYQSQPLLQQP
jgi:hypothetical protein